MDVVRMVLTGQISRALVSAINEHGPLAAAFSGEDAGLFQGRRRGVFVDGAEVDLGLVGDVVGVDPAAVLAQLDAGRIPVVSSITLRTRSNSLRQATSGTITSGVTGLPVLPAALTAASKMARACISAISG